MKRGLIMEGGALRGMFTPGVTDVFLENGIEFDGAVGVSAGAAFGCNFKSRQIGRAIRYNLANCKNPRYCSFASLFFTGNMFGAKYCYETIPYKTDIFDWETYRNNPLEFFAVATDIESGEPVYHRCDTLDRNEMEWIRASSSLPLAAKIVKIDDKKLMDGGVSDSIPLKFFEASGYDRNVVILTRPQEYIKKPSSLMKLIRIKYRKYPKLIERLENRHIEYNETVSYVKEKEARGEIFVIRPPYPLPTGHTEHDPERIRQTYEIGRQTALGALDELKNFLNKQEV